MKYRNNLNDSSQNSYFQVTDSFAVLIPIGTYESNVSIGSTKMNGVLYKSITLSSGDYLYDLHGGVFVSYAGKFHPAKMKLSEKHPLEKTYDDGIEVWPIQKLKLITKPDINFNYEITVPVVNTPSSFYGRGIDAVEF